MSSLAQPVIAWLERNLVPIAKNALLQDRRIAWGGRFKHGEKVPVGAAVLYIDKLMLAISDNQDSLPVEGAKGFRMLVDLKHMRVVEDSFVGGRNKAFEKAKTRMSVIADTAIEYGVSMVEQKVKAAKIDGYYQWRGIFKSGYSYNPDDIVAYNGAIYKAISGSGVPTTAGWERLEGRSRSTGLAITRTYIVDDDGNYVIDDSGNYVVSD